VYEIICTHAAGDVPDHPRYYPTPEALSETDN